MLMECSNANDAMGGRSGRRGAAGSGIFDDLGFGRRGSRSKRLAHPRLNLGDANLLGLDLPRPIGVRCSGERQ